MDISYELEQLRETCELLLDSITEVEESEAKLPVLERSIALSKYLDHRLIAFKTSFILENLSDTH